MGYDPTQQVPPPQGYSPPTYGVSQQPTYVQPPVPPAYTPPPPAPATYAQYASAPPPPTAMATTAGFDFSTFWKSLGLTGQAAGVGGLLLFLFFLFPWVSGGGDSSNGFSIASATGSLFFYVWLIFLGMLGLGAMAWLISRRLWFSRLTATSIVLAIAGVMAALELSFLLTINSFYSAFDASIRGTAAGVGVGFWLDFLGTLAVAGLAIYGVVQERKALNPLAVSSYQQAIYPGSQPSYPGSQPTAYPPSQAYPAAQPPTYQYPGSQPPAYPYPNQQQPPQYPGQ